MKKEKVTLLLTDKQARIMGYTCESFSVEPYTDLERFFSGIGMPRKAIGIIHVNGARAYLNYVLQAGDIIEMEDPRII